MRSTYMGLEIARRGLFTQQSALYTTGQNVSNANTPGYSRQRVNFNQTTPYPSIGIESPKLPGQMGTGVEGGTVQRIRESFLDVQFRAENNKMGYYGALSESLKKMEGIMNEPTESGLQNTLDQFWNALQDLTTQTGNSGARDVVAARGQMVADTLNYYYDSLTQVQQDIGKQVDVKATEINALVSQIDHLNQQVADVEPHGYLPNDLYDQRDLLVDQLSGLVNIKVTNIIPNNYGNAKDIAEGLYNIELVGQDGSSNTPPVNLITVTKGSGIIGTNALDISYVQDSASSLYGLVENITVGGKSIKFSGELGGLVESFGYVGKDSSGNDIAVGYYPEMLDKLNTMTKAFADEFNFIHKNGYALNTASPSGKDFFVLKNGIPAAEGISVNTDIINNSNLIAAGLGSGASGDNANAQRLADISRKNFDMYDIYNPLPLGGGLTKPQELTGTLSSFYAGMIGTLGVDSQSVQKDYSNTSILAASVETNRQSVSAVSLDEEMTNMIKYQQAYNSSARMITVMDEMLDKIINGMGTVGR